LAGAVWSACEIHSSAFGLASSGEDILAELGLEFFDPSKGLNVSQAIDKVNLQRLSIERASEVDQMHLDL
jgi:hypothetical protein